ncbi:calcium-binding protein [Microvirga puerhi]|uniref:Calcium-binding protein n=1 Tax=Microvirga puerhi TaxID=2876078 RepID=A0ABS7VNW9_9HYPH|nr:calcium-binding protein [Microvirga puerhi]MBZ6077239.1 hypothetical protein [Microvirga puerhi]
MIGRSSFQVASADGGSGHSMRRQFSDASFLVREGGGLHPKVQRYNIHMQLKVEFSSMFDSALTSLSDGRYLSVWTSSSNAVLGQINSAGASATGPAFSISASEMTKDHLSVTELSSGRFVVVWEETSAAGKHSLQGRLFEHNAIPVASAFEIGPSSANRTSPSVIADAIGGFSVFANDGPKVTRVNIDASGAQGAPKVLLDDATNPSAAILQDGSAIIVAATPSDTGGYEISGVSQNPAGEVTMSRVLAIRNEPSAPHPVVTGLTSGGFVVAWEGQVNGRQSVIFQDYLKGGLVFGSASHFDPVKPGQVFSNPMVQALQDGGYAYAAKLGTAGDNDVYMGSVWSVFASMSADLVDASSSKDQVDPSLTRLPDGRYVISWLEGSASDYVLRSKVIDARSSGVTVTGTRAGDDYVGSKYDDTLSGGDGNDYLSGNGGDDRLDGGTGADTMAGGDDWTSNNTTYVVDNVLDTCVETANGGTDKIVTSINWKLGQYIENLSAIGSDPLVLVGNGLANAIAGNSGDNQISGGAGNDVLSGGAGKDIFILDAKPNKKSNLDKITDFSVKDDTIWLENKYLSKLGKGIAAKPGKLNKAFFMVGAKAKDKNDYLVYDNKKGILYYDADGSGGKAAVELAILKKGLKLTYHDFFVI